MSDKQGTYANHSATERLRSSLVNSIPMPDGSVFGFICPAPKACSHEDEHLPETDLAHSLAQPWESVFHN